MKNVTKKVSLVISSFCLGGMLLVFGGCKNTEVTTISDDELGLRKTTLFNENVTPDSVDYKGAAAGESKLIERSYENAPPLISHDVSDLLPITKDNNMCLSCHEPSIAEAVNATPMPKTHFYNFKTRKVADTMQETRYNCVACHTPQANVQPIVGNTFKPDFREDSGKNHSNLIDVLNDGVH